jgi:hypothetical protein
MNQKIIMIYQDFLEEVNKLDSNDAHNLVTLVRTFFRRPSDVEKLLPDFDERVGNELNLLTEQYVESAEVRELAEWMLDQTGAQNDNPQIQYAFIAVQRHLTQLISFLTFEDAACLADRFAFTFPKWKRFPIHTELIAKLKNQSKK